MRRFGCLAEKPKLHSLEGKVSGIGQYRIYRQKVVLPRHLDTVARKIDHGNLRSRGPVSKCGQSAPKLIKPRIIDPHDRKTDHLKCARYCAGIVGRIDKIGNSSVTSVGHNKCHPVDRICASSQQAHQNNSEDYSQMCLPKMRPDSKFHFPAKRLYTPTSLIKGRFTQTLSELMSKIRGGSSHPSPSSRIRQARSVAMKCSSFSMRKALARRARAASLGTKADEQAFQ